ncbi:hypothetical protein OHA21_19885 [Actinoplanes sp. NBC_00393]|uniref:hypothetical protein n=1 Tax=Actinoplanes sp. NBC_00393 TaxID=2975953 RepID=UPI002E2472BF
MLPELLAGAGVPRDQAVWLVPTEDFQRHHYRQRTWARDLLAAAPDPEAAFDRWMQRDALFARRVAVQARNLGYPIIIVDGTTDAGHIATTVDGLLSPL